MATIVRAHHRRATKPLLRHRLVVMAGLVAGLSANVAPASQTRGACVASHRFVTTTYQALLGTDPKPGDLAAIVTALQHGLPRQEVFRDVLRQRPPSAAEALVTALFQAVLEREPRADELSEWTAHAKAPKVTAEGLLDRMLGSPAFATRLAACKD